MTPLDRRELLQSFLGIAAASSCSRTQREVPVLFVDGVSEVGHLLRDSQLPLASEDARVVDCLIVGGGVAGLSAAWRLAAGGVTDVLLAEVDRSLGGTAKSGQNSVSAFPWGAHYLPAPLSPRGPVPRLLREMGVLTGVDEHGVPTYAEDALVHEPEERLFYRGAWYEGLYLRAGASAEDLAQLAAFDSKMNELAAVRDAKGRKAFEVPIELGSDDAEWTALDRISMADWMTQNRFTSSRLKWLVDYACRDDYGATAESISAWAGLWYFCSKQSGKDRNEGFLSWPEGNGRLVAQLSKSISSQRVLSSTLVHTLAPDAASADWLAHAFDSREKRPLRIRARHVIVATPRFVAKRLLEPWRLAPPAFLTEFRTGPWTVANLTLREVPQSRGFPLSWDNVLYESRSLGYVVATHQRLTGAPVGKTVFTWYYPHDGQDVVAERKRLWSTTPEQWRDVILGDLRRAHRRFDELVESIEVMRWGHAMIRPVPGFLWGDARRVAQQPLGNLHFAHSDLGGLALFEEANWHGVRAAEEILQNSSASWL